MIAVISNQLGASIVSSEVAAEEGGVGSPITLAEGGLVPGKAAINGDTVGEGEGTPQIVDGEVVEGSGDIDAFRHPDLGT
jgi:hypothetical protein